MRDPAEELLPEHAPHSKPAAADPARDRPGQPLARLAPAGNRAITTLLRTPAGGGARVQRHNSYEHQLLGDTKPADVAKAKQLEPDSGEAWRHLVEEEYARVTFFTGGAEQDPRGQFPDVRWVKLGTSKLWVSSGELSAFGDYLPNPDAIDTLPAATLVPIVQRMRQEIARSIHDRLTGGTDGLKTEDADAYTIDRNRKTAMKGAVGNDKAHLLPAEAQTIQDLNDASGSLGANRQKGLMARNACHFAPYSWERWAEYHNEARALADAAHKAKAGLLTMRANSDRAMGDSERKAWITNGYANHFLQDSFAAGHLVNKTLVMQWFVEWNQEQGLLDRPWFGVPDQAANMTTAKQPGIADRRAYSPRLHTTATQDHAETGLSTDPQGTLERTSQQGRVAGAGVTGGARAYADYAAFLNSAYLNLAANDIHDVLNHSGLKVRNKAGNEFVVGGDGTLLLEDSAAIEVTLRADALTDQAIHEILTFGSTSVTPEQIFDLFPSTVLYEATAYPLQQWNDQVLKKICRAQVFPEMAGKLTYKGVRLVGSELLDGAGPGGGVLGP
jgi:hypothetical protein